MSQKGERNDNGGWKTVSIRCSISDKINEFIENGCNPTITNPSQFVDMAVREKLERDGGERC